MSRNTRSAQLVWFAHLVRVVTFSVVSNLQATADGGLICITCTDMGVLCGNAPETGYSKYGALPIRTKACHEMALRIVLQSVEAHANRYGRYIEPLLSLSIDFYCRTFVRIRTSQREVKRSTSKLGQVYKCTGCEALTVQPLGQVHTSIQNMTTFLHDAASGGHGTLEC